MWDTLPGIDHYLQPIGPDGGVFAMKYVKPSSGPSDAVSFYIYVGGSFTAITNEGDAFNNIARWNEYIHDNIISCGSFSYVGDGFDDTVYTLEVLDNNLYAGGDFLNSGSTAVNHIARWDGNSWSALGPGLNDSVYAIVAFNNSLYVGGNFTMSGDNSVNHIAKWDGNSWSSIGNGLSGGPVNAIAFGTSLTISNQ